MWKRCLTVSVAALWSLSAQAECSFRRVVNLPITMVGPVPQIEASINGRPTRFILDSGAFWSVISPETAAENALHREPAPRGMTMVGIGGSTALDVVRVKSLMLANVSLPDIEFVVGGSEVGGRAGVIGQNVLHYADVEYDLAHGRASLFEAKGCGDKSLAYWTKPDEPVSELPLYGNNSRFSHTKATILINGQKVHAVFDTGAGSSVLSLAVAAKLGIKPGGTGVIAAGMGRGFGSRMVQTWIAPLSEIKIGGETLRNNKMRIQDLGDTEMLIGADFFLAHRVYVANSQSKIYFIYTGGNFFNVSGGERRAVDGEGKALALPTSEADPVDAEGYSRRGMATASQGKVAAGIADLDKAIELAPNEIRYRLQRAALNRRAQRRDLVQADLDRALQIDPNNTMALLDRAALHISRREPGDAKVDLARAAQLLDKASDARFGLAEMLGAVEEPAAAIPVWTTWIDAHPADSRRPIALNGRCWSRALANQDLSKALSDCNAALRTTPYRAMVLDSRGLVKLRMGDNAGANADYTEALSLNAKMPWSLYGRGIVRLRLGDKTGSVADLDAAAKLAPIVAERAKHFGIVP